MFVCLWSGTWRGGFAWDGSFLQFNWHPVLMVTSLVVLYGNAIVLYRVPLTWSRWWCKRAHAGLLFVAMVLSVLGVCAAFDFHTANNIPHLYSLHSWTGISTVALFTLQWFVGLCAFLLPWTPLAFRALLKPLHIWMGIAIFILSLITSLSGINEKLLLTLRNGRNGSNTKPYTTLPAEALFANSFGIVVVIFGLLVLKLLFSQKWKNPESENETDRAHPSVCVRGTEHTYTPVLCQDEKCLGQEKGVHMHCPLCSVAEIYQDPVILRAHFRIKHVDKGIDFAGLKVLRCCVHCEIVGTIKGEKRFKGAHWHCYRCRNGFNRRDEAIKHYKTHFRNPHTTFQIQVTQNVNCRQYYGESSEAHAKAYEGLAVSLGPSGDGFGSILTQPILTTDTETLLTVEPKEDCERNGIPLGAEEEVGSSQNSSDGTQTLVLMDPDGQGNSVIYDTATGILTEQEAESLEQTLLQKRLLELHQQIDTLRQEKESMEKTLRAEIKQLKEQLESLEAQHKELLQAQLASLRREILSGADNMPINGHKGALELNVDSEESQTEAISGTLTGLEDMDVQLQTEQHKSTELELVPTDTIPCLQSPGLDLDLPNSGLTTTKVLEDKQEVSLSFVSSKKRSSADDSEEMTESKVQRVS
ncbi:hypothetical protein cypCar_00026691 [Cyprinus carpio]|nr:hypothetical protein cypCar_00026691 [Cyprinus carpio]